MSHILVGSGTVCAVKLFCCSKLSLVVTNFLTVCFHYRYNVCAAVPVEDIIARYTKGSVRGPELWKKLHSGTKMERCEL